MPSHSSRPDSLFETAYTARQPCQNRRVTLRFSPQLEMRPCSIARNTVESREAPPHSTVSLISHRHTKKLPEITVTNRGNPGFPAATLRKTSRFFLQCVLRPDSPTVTLEQCCTPPCNSNGDWTSLGQHKRHPEFPVVTRESCHNSRKTTRFPPPSPVIAR